ncbi:aminotransferase class V-fold PLP-dependent enzyme [Luteolibacter yonseiensis]|uniref:cysteine desulfurase n=1 Tax=Luteolibacter yonseiensis TaxID=1144680 RepID=A0A934R6U1_9BACT|nr:aminotransferase class V-fold PLP-dependent enzyme [Luteolibacter yonseiensis]MBK1818082.1 aminotransferase class V-fold PLP-dependent enzyme [Luteolibacter yonseiensis]
MIYLDANATTPLLPEVLDAMLPWLRDGFSNPSGAYAGAKAARKAIDHARGQVAALIGAEPGEIIFTGGGTESVNTALHSLDRLTGQGKAVVSSIEHSAVLRYVEGLERSAAKVAVTLEGRLEIDNFVSSLDGAAFVSVMAANNETGVIQPLSEIVALAHERGLPVHTDAIQAAGKIPLDVRALGVDMLSMSAHKFHGPKGVGALFVRDGLRFKPLLEGGGQEAGRRSGTENTAGIVGMGAAAEWMMKHSSESTGAIRDAFEAKALEEISGIRVNGDTLHRLPNTSHLSFDRCDAAGLLILLDEAGVACSAGSACMTGKQKPSHVQLAMGIPEEIAKSSLRISFSRLNTMEEALAAATALKKAVEKLRRVQGSGVGPVVVYSP